MSKISVRDVMIGAVVDTFGSLLIGVPVVMAVLIGSFPTHRLSDLSGRPGVLYVALLLNELAFAALGGYIAAWLAHHDELLNGGLSAFLRLLEYGFLTSNGAGDHFLTTQALLFPIAVPVCAALGGYLRLRQKSGSRSQ